MASNSKGKSTARESKAADSADVPSDKIRGMIALLKGTDVSLLDWSNGSERIVIQRALGVAQATAFDRQPSVPSAPASLAPSHGKSESPPKVPGAHAITSPFVGTFYRAASPDAPSFVEIGQTVRKGQVLCIVEAMKLMNEIEAEAAGKVIEVLVENGKTVEFGQPLFTLQTT